VSENEVDMELKRKMRRVAAPDGFAEAVMGRVAASPVRRRPMALRRFTLSPRRMAWLWPALVSAMLLAVGVTSYAVHRQRQLELAAETQARFDVAMRITSRTLMRVSEEVTRAGVKRSDSEDSEK